MADMTVGQEYLPDQNPQKTFEAAGSCSMMSGNFSYEEGQVGATWIERYASEQNCCSHTLSAFLSERTIVRLYLAHQADPGSLRVRDRFRITYVGRLHLVAVPTIHGS